MKEVMVMPFGMEEAEIESKVIAELSARPGHVLRLNDYQIELIARAIASVIFENNLRMKYSLGSKMDNEGTSVGKTLSTPSPRTRQGVNRIEEKAMLAGNDIRMIGSTGEELHLFGKLDELIYTSGLDKHKHEFIEPKPLLIRLLDGSIFLLRDESKYNVSRNSGGKWELIG
jgi:hypothetical protein